MKLIEVRESEMKIGRDMTPHCEVAKIIHLSAHKYAIAFNTDIAVPAIGFESEAFTKFVKNPPSPIVDIKAHEHICLCCDCVSEEIVLTISTKEGNKYQISESAELTMLINISIVD
ncbi:hypothetical protein DDZ13_05450 [Coraliomargarita sinensis]|uniref:Uncharacterized protein n=1 Tax=Coraliomargarita sinensis TaxID=2174842 RepID=A0A317ZLB6_9BACT|nr:hypothetical protein [Coraliomargarita sinensis]PXA04619.1 hypothetical protein DDZ13_05450 [Coraliomargarita sinensis]